MIPPIALLIQFIIVGVLLVWSKPSKQCDRISDLVLWYIAAILWLIFVGWALIIC